MHWWFLDQAKYYGLENFILIKSILIEIFIFTKESKESISIFNYYNFPQFLLLVINFKKHLNFKLRPSESQSFKLYINGSQKVEISTLKPP